KLVTNIKRSWKAPASVSAEPAATGVSELVARWNRKYPVGTKVTSDLYTEELRTRTEAMVLFGHRAAVYMDGYNGYFDLRDLKPVA
ncbi:MAG TPA: [acyl-carrier-protein] S-malonyltransferase, partial [Fibrobacteria bacterium]|nr:[acyl-carrier-protein] S-malonyltransferase [Fibrobacteria bacterium]